jgi:hypothetical protein
MTTSFPTKTFMAPRQEAWPSFEDVVFIVLLAVGFAHSVCIVCFSPYMLSKWQERLAALPAEAVMVLAVDGTSPAELCRYLARHKSDFTVLSGARSALMGNRTTVSFIRSLAAAIPSGTVIAA